MPEFKITISGKALRRLAETAVAERRPIDLQAEVLVLRQLGCWPDDQIANEAEWRLGEKEAVGVAS